MSTPTIREPARYELVAAGDWLKSAALGRFVTRIAAQYRQHQLVRIDILVAEPERALDNLEPLLKIPYYLSPERLKIDLNFDPLRKNPRFQKLIAS